MSKTSARHQALQEFLSARGYATIEELARHFEVTPQTVRKDINALAEEGKVQRFHGGAGMVSGSENIVYDERKASARKKSAASAPCWRRTSRTAFPCASISGPPLKRRRAPCLSTRTCAW